MSLHHGQNARTSETLRAAEVANAMEMTMNTTTNIRTTIAATVTALMLALPLAASADNTGTPGKLIGLEHNGPKSDAWVRGAVMVDEGNDVTRTYSWGGSICPEKDLDIDQQQLLATAISHRMSIFPRYKLGSGNMRCLVSFTLTRPLFVDKLP